MFRTQGSGSVCWKIGIAIIEAILQARKRFLFLPDKSAGWYVGILRSAERGTQTSSGRFAPILRHRSFSRLFEFRIRNQPWKSKMPFNVPTTGGYNSGDEFHFFGMARSILRAEKWTQVHPFIGLLCPQPGNKMSSDRAKVKRGRKLHRCTFTSRLELVWSVVVGILGRFLGSERSIMDDCACAFSIGWCPSLRREDGELHPWIMLICGNLSKIILFTRMSISQNCTPVELKRLLSP